MNTRCKKCGLSCGHPRWDSAADVLKFACICGYSWTAPTMDSKESVDRDLRLRAQKILATLQGWHSPPSEKIEREKPIRYEVKQWPAS